MRRVSWERTRSYVDSLTIRKASEILGFSKKKDREREWKFYMISWRLGIERDSPTGIDGRSSIAQLHGHIERIKDDQIISNSINVYDVRIYQERLMIKKKKRQQWRWLLQLLWETENVLNCLLHSAYFNHSWLVGRSNKFPMKGSFLGPGGNGNEECLLLE